MFLRAHDLNRSKLVQQPITRIYIRALCGPAKHLVAELQRDGAVEP